MKTLYSFIKQLRFLTTFSIFFLADIFVSAAKGSINIIFTTVNSKNISLKARIYSIAINNTMISEKEAVRLVVTR